MTPSKIYELRKEGKIEEAYALALKFIERFPEEDDVKKALTWTLIDLCKKFISENNLTEAQVYLNQAIEIEFEWEDQFVQTIKKQISYLKPKIDIHFPKIQNADNLSKTGQCKQALNIMRSMAANNELGEQHHETYGWIIYRCMKAEENNFSSVEIRTLLRDYMELKNERPSMIHSMILNFALNYSKNHSDFKFYNFFKLWHPENLRYEDLQDGKNQEGNKIPSLISRICREFLNSNTVFDIEQDLIAHISLNRETILDFFREPYFWNIQKIYKEGKFDKVWNLFENYSVHYCNYGKSKYHSEVLNLAERYMKENEEWRFLNFFKKWDAQNLRAEDWAETRNGENTYKPLAIKSLKKAFEVLKNQKKEQDLTWLITLYEKAVNKYPFDEWLLREKALLQIRNNEIDQAIKIYKKLVLDLGNKYYIWQEFSSCFDSDPKIKIGMLAKALVLENNEDFLGEIHLEMAQQLINENLLENACIELDAYKKHRELKRWKIPPIFDELQLKISVVKTSIIENKELYNKHIEFAESFAYADFAWQEMVLIDQWKDERGKERLAFTNGKSLEFQVGKNRFYILRHAEIGQVFKFKLHMQEIIKETNTLFGWGKPIKEYKFIPLMAGKTGKGSWSILDDTIAIVDYVNKEKNVIHAITSDSKELFFPQLKEGLQIGDFITAKIFSKKIKEETRTELRQIQKAVKEEALLKFPDKVAIIDHVNEQKQLYHYVIDSKLQGILKFTEIKFTPKEGDFIKLRYYSRTDKEKKLRVKVLSIEPTKEVNTSLKKTISGTLSVKFKYNYDDEFDSMDLDDCDDDEFFDKILNGNKKGNASLVIPDFAFIGDHYVSKKLLEKYNITNDCNINAEVIYVGDKWKVIDLFKK